MAWEKNGKCDWILRKKGERRIIRMISVDENYGGHPIVDIEFFDESSKDKRITFKTKKQAIAYAKKWMKEHPNG